MARDVYILVDDYDLISGLPLNPLSTLGDLIFQGRDAGIHVVLARSSGGASRAMLDPVIGRLVESGAPALILSGDPHEGRCCEACERSPCRPAWTAAAQAGRAAMCSSPTCRHRPLMWAARAESSRSSSEVTLRAGAGGG